MHDDPHVKAIVDVNSAIANSSFLHNQFWLDQFDHAHQQVAANGVTVHLNSINRSYMLFASIHVVAVTVPNSVEPAHSVQLPTPSA